MLLLNVVGVAALTYNMLVFKFVTCCSAKTASLVTYVNNCVGKLPNKDILTQNMMLLCCASTALKRNQSIVEFLAFFPRCMTFY